MVIKVKVSDVAKDLGKQNKDIIELLSAYCDGPAKKAGSKPAIQNVSLDINSFCM